MSRTKAELQRMIRAALGEINADLVITGGKLINVYSGEVLEGFEIAVSGGRICYVGPSAQHARGETTEVLDACGFYVSPGFIDGHTHIGHYARPFENLQSFLPHGTTAVMASCDEMSTVFGYRGLKVFLDEVERHPVKVFTLISMVAPQDPLLCNTASLSQQEIAEALSDPRVLGVGEIVSWLRLLQCDDALLETLERAHRSGQIIHGHTAGAKDRKLSAVATAGISSCHEPIRLEDALERLRLGYWTMLREGSLRRDLQETLKPLIKLGVSLQRLILVTDSMSPDDVEELGHMDNVVRRAISLGLPPMQALQAVTLNPAIYSGLDQEIGGIAPGRWADIVLIEDLEQCRVGQVLVKGKTVAREGKSVVDERAPMTLPEEMFSCLTVRPTISAEQLVIASPSPAPRVRVMELLNQTITAEKVLKVEAASGLLVADPQRDLLKVAMFDRHHGTKQPSLGFLNGFGARVGAVGLTANLDENTLLVVGRDDQDMALCANALIAAGGGIAIVDDNLILEKIDFPFGGIFSLDPWSVVGKRLRRIQNRLHNRGSPFDKPIFALTFLPFVSLPSLRITSRGLVNVKERKIVSLIESEDF
jgi:adenine deaminase